MKISKCLRSVLLCTAFIPAILNGQEGVGEIAPESSGKSFISGTILAKENFAEYDYATIIENRKKKQNIEDEEQNQEQETLNLNVSSAYGDETRLPEQKLIAALTTMRDRLLEGIPGDFPNMPIFVSDGTGINAYANDLGEITFGTGLLLNAKHEDEVAFALAHEIAHVLLDHFRDKENRDSVYNSIKTTTETMMYVEQYTGTNYNKTGQDALKIATVAEMYIGPSWDKEQEHEADKLAIDLMVAAEYSRYGADGIMNMLMALEQKQKEEKESKCDGLGKQILDQTGLSKTVDGLGSIFGKKKNIPVQTKPVPPECNVFNNVFEDLMKSHASAEDRFEEIQEYVDEHHSKQAPFPMKAFAGENGNMLDEYSSPNGPVFRSIKASESIEKYLSGEYKGAFDLARQSLDTKDDYSVKPRIANYYILNDTEALQSFLNQTEVATLETSVSHLDVIINSGYATRFVYNSRINEHIKLGEYEPAISLVMQKAARWGEREEAKPRLIRLWAYAGNTENATKVYESCKYKKTKDNKEIYNSLKEIEKKCKATAEEMGIIKKKSFGLF